MVSARERGEQESRAIGSIRELEAEQRQFRETLMLTSTARLKQSVSLFGSRLIQITPAEAGEFGVELAFDVADGVRLWRITGGRMAGSIIKEALLDFSSEQIDTGFRPCSQCGCEFKSTYGFSHCEDHRGLSIKVV